MNEKEKENIDYKNFLKEILQQIENAKNHATLGINKVKIGLYYPTTYNFFTKPFYYQSLLKLNLFLQNPMKRVSIRCLLIF